MWCSFGPPSCHRIFSHVVLSATCCTSNLLRLTFCVPALWRNRTYSSLVHESRQLSSIAGSVPGARRTRWKQRERRSGHVTSSPRAQGRASWPCFRHRRFITPLLHEPPLHTTLHDPHDTMADASGEVKPVDDTATAILRPKKSCVPHRGDRGCAAC
jgi:hypothetical protein